MSDYKSVSALAEDFASSRQWVYKILREMEGLQRYKGERVKLNDGYKLFVNVDCFIDYLFHRADIRQGRKLGEYKGEKNEKITNFCRSGNRYSDRYFSRLG